MGCHTTAYVRLALTPTEITDLATAELDYLKIKYPRRADIWEQASQVEAGEWDAITTLAGYRYEREHQTTVTGSGSALYEEVGAHAARLSGLDEDELYELTPAERAGRGIYLCHNPFRVHGQDLQLHSEAETLAYIAQRQADGQFIDLWTVAQHGYDSYALIHEFWTRHPDGLLVIC